MSICKVFFVAVVLSAYSTAVHARGCFWCICRPPLEGTWRIAQSFPDKNGMLELHVNADLMLQNVAANIYNATGIANQVAPVQIPNFPIVLVAQFDVQTCVLSGTIYARDLNASSPFSWTSYGGRYMEGPYLGVLNYNLFFPATGVQEVTFIE